MRRIFFFATKSDIEPVLLRFQAEQPLQFVKNVNITSPPQAAITRVTDIPTVGFATHRSSVGSDQYLVSSQDAPIMPDTIRGAQGETRFVYNHSKWPKSVVMRLGGLWLGRTLLPGLVDTLHDTTDAQALMKRFLKSLKSEDFNKVDIYWVGKEAMAMLKAGRRLATAAYESPPEFDLTLPT